MSAGGAGCFRVSGGGCKVRGRGDLGPVGAARKSPLRKISAAVLCSSRWRGPVCESVRAVTDGRIGRQGVRRGGNVARRGHQRRAEIPAHDKDPAKPTPAIPRRFGSPATCDAGGSHIRTHIGLTTVPRCCASRLASSVSCRGPPCCRHATRSRHRPQLISPEDRIRI